MGSMDLLVDYSAQIGGIVDVAAPSKCPRMIRDLDLSRAQLLR